MPFGHDLQYSLRVLRGSKAFTAFTVVVLAIGIAAITVTFSIARAYLWRPLAFNEPARLVHVWSLDVPHGWDLRVSVPDYLDWQARTATLEDLAAFNYTGETLTGGSQPERIQAGRVSANALNVLGVSPALGRGFLPGEDQPGAAGVVILSDRFWRNRFQGRADALGQRMEINGAPHTIVGVMAPSFVFPLLTTEFLVPRTLDPAKLGRDREVLQVMGRLKPGVTLAQAQADLERVAAELRGAYPATNAQRSVRVVPLKQALSFAYDLFVAMTAVFFAGNVFVLLIVCANIGALLLGKSLSRQREIALRSALGASRGRIVRQLLVESLVLAAAAAVAGVAIARVVCVGLEGVIPADVYRVGGLAVDGPGFAFAGCAALATALVFGLAPALRSARGDVVTTLQQNGATITNARGAARWQHALAAVQIGLAVVLLASTALTARSLVDQQRANPGFDARDVETLLISLPAERYPNAGAITAFQSRLIDEARAIPGALSAATVDQLPLNHETNREPIDVPSHPAPSGEKPSAIVLSVGGDYFAALRVRLERGRTFANTDRAATERVAIVNTTLAAHHWGGVDPIGSTIHLNGIPHTVVGIVAPTRHESLSGAWDDQIYVSQAQSPARYFRLIVRGTAGVQGVSPAAAALVRRLDPALPVAERQKLTTVVDEFLLPQRAIALSFIVLGFGALGLALVGVYAVAALFASLRRREIGIRMALGATRKDVMRLVLGRGFRVSLAGAGLGAACAAGAAPLLSSVVGSVRTADPVALVVVPSLLVAAAVGATWLPARRAAATDPSVTLRAE